MANWFMNIMMFLMVGHWYVMVNYVRLDMSDFVMYHMRLDVFVMRGDRRENKRLINDSRI